MSPLPVAPPLRSEGCRVDLEPVVLRFAVRSGWAGADRGRRRSAVLTLAMPLVWAGSVPLTPSLDDHDAVWFGASIALTLLVLVAGPPACHSAARVLRPHPPGTGMERRARHWCAAIATAYGGAALTLFVQGGLALSPGFYLFVPAAVSLGPITVVWGAVAALLRAGSRRRARSAPSP